MIIDLHKSFKKQLEKMTPKQRSAVKEKLGLFLFDPFHSRLNNHALKGKLLNYRSINITGDLRAIYKLSDDGQVAVFAMLGNHNQLYS